MPAQILAAALPVQLSTYTPGEAAEGEPRTCAPATAMEVPDVVPGSSFQPGPAEAAAVTWKLPWLTEDHSLAL